MSMKLVKILALKSFSKNLKLHLEITTSGSLYPTSLDSEELSKVCFFSLVYKDYKWSLIDSHCFPVAKDILFSVTLECTERKEMKHFCFCSSVGTSLNSTFCCWPLHSSGEKQCPDMKTQKRFVFIIIGKEGNCYESRDKND